MSLTETRFQIAARSLGPPAVCTALAFDILLGVGALLAAIYRSSFQVLCTVVAACALVALARLVPATLVVKNDGVILRWLGFRRPIAFADLESFERAERRIVFRRKNGSTFCVLYARRQNVSVLAFRVACALRAYRQGVAQAEKLTIPIFVNEPARDLLLRLRAFANQYRDPRHFKRRCGVLRVILDNPGASEFQRIGAAILLNRASLGSDRLRVLNAAESTISPELRRALRAVANHASDDVLANHVASAQRIIKTESDP